MFSIKYLFILRNRKKVLFIYFIYIYIYIYISNSHSRKSCDMDSKWCTRTMKQTCNGWCIDYKVTVKLFTETLWLLWVLSLYPPRSIWREHRFRFRSIIRLYFTPHNNYSLLPTIRTLFMQIIGNKHI